MSAVAKARRRAYFTAKAALVQALTELRIMDPRPPAGDGMVDLIMTEASRLWRRQNRLHPHAERPR